MAGIGDFASRSHFWSNLICKSVQDGKFLLIYVSFRTQRRRKLKELQATPHEDAVDYDQLAGQGGDQNGGGEGGQYGEDASAVGGGGSQGPSNYNEGPPQQKEGGYPNVNFLYRA